MIDKRELLKNNPFSYRESRERVFIQFKKREIMVLKGKEASKLIGRLYGEDEFSQQLILAKITGQFK